MRKRTRLLLFCVYTCLPCSFWLLLLFLFSCEVEIATCPLLLSPRGALPCVPRSCVLDRLPATLARAMLFRLLEKGGFAWGGERTEISATYSVARGYRGDACQS